MKPYPKYKPSDIQWLGNIPEHWEVKKLKYVVDLINQKSDDIKSAFNIALENIESGTGKIINIDVDKEFEGELRSFQKNDVLFSKLRPYLCKVYLAEREGTCVGELLIFRPKTFILPNYLFYNVFSKEFINAVDGSTYGTKMPRASWEDFISHQLIPIPPLSEQTAIAQFLDQKTAQIDTLIAQKQRLISLLKEERMAFINEILSDESFPLKKLKYVVDLVNQKMNSQESTHKIALENIESGTGRIINLNVDKEFEGELRGFGKDDILFSKLRPYLCKVYLAEKEGTCVGELLIFRPKLFVLPKFLFYKVFSQEFINAVDGSTYGTKMPRASWEDFISHQLIPVPPLKTQQRIVESIETTTGKIDATLAKIVQEIELLKEYRVALISEVVTGKISVV